MIASLTAPLHQPEDHTRCACLYFLALGDFTANFLCLGVQIQSSIYYQLLWNIKSWIMILRMASLKLHFRQSAEDVTRYTRLWALGGLQILKIMYKTELIY